MTVPSASPAPVDLASDRAWLDDFRAGKEAALERVFRVYAPYVLAILRRGYSNGRGEGVPGFLDVETQHDLMQEIFARVLSPTLRNNYDGIRPFTGYLRAVTGNVMMEEVRKRTRAAARLAPREPTEQEMMEQESWTPGAPPPDQVCISAEQRQLVRDYLATLSPPERAFVEVRFHQGASQRDTANALGLGRQAVRSLEQRLREGFKAFASRWRRSDPPLDNPDP